jgi:hypothetical protein
LSPVDLEAPAEEGTKIDKDPRKSELLLSRVLRSTSCILYHPPKWKERDEGRRPKKQKSIAKQEKRTKDQTPKKKKMVLKREDLKKKTSSRNRPPASIQKPYRCCMT